MSISLNQAHVNQNFVTKKLKGDSKTLLDEGRQCTISNLQLRTIEITLVLVAMWGMAPTSMVLQFLTTIKANNLHLRQFCGWTGGITFYSSL